MTKPMTKEEQVRRKKKTESVRNLAQQIHKLRRKLTTDMKSDDEKIRLTALAVAIMDKTAERVGNEQSAKEGHVGVTGFKNNQIDVNGNTISLKYTGKSGVKQEKQFSDGLMAKIIKECKGNCKGKDSPVLVTADGFKIRADKVNRYLKDFGVTAKDIRGYAANTLVTGMLNAGKTPSTPEERQKKFREVMKAVADKVGHQQATLKKHYLLPGIEESYVKSGHVKSVKNASERIVSRLFVAAIAERLVVENVEYYNMAWYAVWDIWPKVLRAYRQVVGRDPVLNSMLHIGINDWDIPPGKVGSYKYSKEGEAFGLLTVSPKTFRGDNPIYQSVIAHELIHMATGMNKSPHNAIFGGIANLVGIPKGYQD